MQYYNTIENSTITTHSYYKHKHIYNVHINTLRIQLSEKVYTILIKYFFYAIDNTCVGFYIWDGNHFIFKFDFFPP